VSAQSILDKNCGGEFDNLEVGERIHPESSSSCVSPPPPRKTELCIHGDNLERIIVRNKEIINNSCVLIANVV
jgi:hypothetical protein